MPLHILNDFRKLIYRHALFKQMKKYRSRRQPNQHYNAPGWYFITICTHQRTHFFGKIRHGEMQLSKVGEVADKFWKEIPQHNRNVRLGPSVVMPNHVHGLLELFGKPLPPRYSKLPAPNTVDFLSAVSPLAGSVSQIIRSYKSAVTREIRPRFSLFAWQPSFHDHVVRDGEYDRIAHYILNNPKNWKEDGFYSSDMPD